MVGPKWKVLDTFSSKPRKKIKKTKAFAGGELKKVKLLASAIFAARTAKV